MAYSVARTDNLMGTDVRAALVSVAYYNNDAPAAIENGRVVKITDLLDKEREIFKAVDVAADDNLNEVALVVGPELMYDERMHRLDEYINEAGEPARAYRLHNGDTFSVTKNALIGVNEPVVGDVVELAAGNKLNVAAKATGATNGSTTVGRIIHIEDTGTYVYYCILVVTSNAGGQGSGDIPSVTSADNGRVLGVSEGQWSVIAPGANTIFERQVVTIPNPPSTPVPIAIPDTDVDRGLWNVTVNGIPVPQVGASTFNAQIGDGVYATILVSNDGGQFVVFENSGGQQRIIPGDYTVEITTKVITPGTQIVARVTGDMNMTTSEITFENCYPNGGVLYDVFDRGAIPVLILTLTANGTVVGKRCGHIIATWLTQSTSEKIAVFNFGGDNPDLYIREDGTVSQDPIM